jgi:monoterpene epsilon-lactone hydrolase
MSLRAEILRVAVRLFFKRGALSQPNIATIRRKLDGIKRIIPGPSRHTRATRLQAGGVPAVRIETKKSRPDRHILYLHGGAYAFGSPSHYRDFLWRIADAACSCVLCIDYRLAPEHPFPAALDDVAAAYRWLLAEGADPRRTAIMGDSSGGGLALAALLRLRDEGLPLPAAAVVLSPWTDLAMSGNSIRLNAEADPMLNPDHAVVFAKWYLAGSDPRHPYASPLYGDPAGLPPCLIQVGSDEVLRDDSVRMAERLRAAGCQVELQVWPRMQHVWQLYARILPEGRQAIEQIGAFLKGKMRRAEG